MDTFGSGGFGLAVLSGTILTFAWTGWPGIIVGVIFAIGWGICLTIANRMYYGPPALPPQRKRRYRRSRGRS